jgi:PAS domain S-box-containing protein
MAEVSKLRLPLAITLFGLIVLGLLWGDSIIEARRDEHTALEQARRDTTNFALAFRADVLRTITAVDQIMLAIKGEDAVDPDHYRLPPWVEDSSFLTGMAMQVAIVDPDGIVRDSNIRPVELGLSVADRPHFRYHLTPGAAQPFISVPVVGRISGRWSIQISRRLERSDGSFAGVLVVSVDPFFLSRFFDELDLGKQGVVTLVGRDGIVRARRAGNSEEIGQDLSASSIMPQVGIHDHGTFDATSVIDGVDRIYGYAVIRDQPLFVVVGMGREEVLATIRSERWRGLLVRGGVSLFVVLLVGLLVREAVRRRDREEAIAEQAALLATILDVTPAAVWVKDEAGRFQIVNDTAMHVLGRPRHELVGRRSPDLLADEVADKVTDWDEQARTSPGTLVSGERDAVIAGEQRHFLTVRRAAMVGGRQMIIGSAIDVTPLRQAEAALRAEMAQREDAEAQLHHAQKLETLGQLTGGIAHDFNNLLTTVLGNLELAQHRARDPEALRRLRNATQAAERGATLVHHLLAFARRQHLQPRPIDLNQLVVEAKEMLDRTLGPGIRIETSLDPGAWAAMADGSQVEVALFNVAINARDAMPAGGRLTIATGNVGMEDARLPASLRPGDYVVLTVTDTGAGMDGAVLARAFDPFFTTKEVGQGSGLGLSQVYGMAQQSGGIVVIESRLGSGTTVHIYLPRAAAELMVGDGQAPPRPTILIVDDDYQVRDFVALYLEEHGYRVIASESGQAAVDAIDKATIDLAILDVAMPGMSGPELARLARQRRPGLPVLFMTGYPNAQVLDRMSGGPMLRKPFKAAKLVAEIEAMLPRSGEAASRVPPRRARAADKNGDA